MPKKSDALKARYYYQMALIEGSRLNQFKAARDHALRAAELIPRWGEPLILIGIFTLEVQRYAAIMNLNRRLFSGQLLINSIRLCRLIQLYRNKPGNLSIDYSKYFPNKELAFFLMVIQKVKHTR